jgi:hypothetical protein
LRPRITRGRLAAALSAVLVLVLGLGGWLVYYTYYDPPLRGRDTGIESVLCLANQTWYVSMYGLAPAATPVHVTGIHLTGVPASTTVLGYYAVDQAQYKGAQLWVGFISQADWAAGPWPRAARPVTDAVIPAHETNDDAWWFAAEIIVHGTEKQVVATGFTVSYTAGWRHGTATYGQVSGSFCPPN